MMVGRLSIRFGKGDLFQGRAFCFKEKLKEWRKVARFIPPGK